jgi:glycosyltransferase involved in cell wall biosynthesis
MKPKIIAVLPAYQAEHTLIPFLKILPKEVFDHIILSDDSSSDKTLEIAKEQKDIMVFRTPENLGYGGNMKFCLAKALEMEGDILIEIHPDGEYLPDGIRKAISEVEKGAQLVLGNRFTRGKPEGMYLWKYIPSRILTWVDNVVLGTAIPDVHQGFRVYTKDFLQQVNFEANNNDYAFTFQILLQALFYNVPLKSVPVTAVYQGEKRGASLTHSFVYTIKTFWIVTQYLLAKRGVKAKFLST